MKHLLILIIGFSFLYQNVMSQCTPDAGMDDMACGLTYTLQGTISQTGSAVAWTTSYPGVIFSNPNQLTTEVFVPSFAGSSLSIAFVFTESNGSIPCTNSDTVVITFQKLAHAEAGTIQLVCGMTTQLSADTIGTGIINGYWTSSVPGILITPTGMDPIAWNPLVDASLLFPGFFINSQREVYFYWHAQNNSGCTSIDSVKITFYEIPIANAGLDTSICGKSYDMIGNWSIVNPFGVWNNSPMGPGTANFTPISLPNAFVSVTDYGDYYFVWKEMNQGNTNCFDRDTVLIHFLTVPTPDAGMDFSVCGTWTQITATPSIQDGHWSSSLVGISYYDGIHGNYNLSYQDSAISYIYTPSENDTVTMYWNEFNGFCYGYDSVNVYFNAIPSAISLVDPTDSFACGPTYTLLNAQMPTYGTGYWLDTIAGTSFYPSSSVPSPSVTIDTGGVNYYGWHYFQWITNYGNCSDTSDVVRVKFIEKPVANAGGNYWPGLFGANRKIKTDTVCGYNYQMNAIPSLGTGIWYTVLSWAEFGNTNLSTTTIYNDSLHFGCTGCFSVFSSTIQYYEFIWQEVNTICASTDTLRLYVAPLPSGEFFVTPPSCPQNNFELIAKTWALPNNEDYGINSFAWNFPNGILDPTILNPSVSDSILVSWNTGSQHPVSLITSNIWGCNSLPFTSQLIEPYSGIISGQLTSSPLIDYSAFMINVYRAETNSEAPLVKTVPLSISGEYNFGVPGAGDFYLQAKQVQSNSNLQFANSYYNNVFEWANAQTIHLTCNDSINLNIPLVNYTPATGGQCRIYGLVRYDGSLDPVQGATVYLRYQPNQDPARFEFTDQNGYYSVNNVPNGNYKLFVDIPGLPQITNHHILVNPNDTVFANVNFIVDTNSISKLYGFGIYADTTGFIHVPLNNDDMIQIAVFPIPFHEQLNLSFTLPSTEKVYAELIDISGKTMMIIQEPIITNGTGNIRFQTSQLEKGIYFLKLEINETVYIKKILKN